MVTFNDLLSWDGTDLFEAGDALVATSHKYEQVNTNLNKPGLGDGLAGQTAEAEAKARRILADDAEDLWTGLSNAGNNLKDASATVNSIREAAYSLKRRAEEQDLTVSADGQISSTSAPGAGGGYQLEMNHLMDQAQDAITSIRSTFDEIANLDDTANGPSPEVVNHGERLPNPKWTPSQVNDWWISLTDEQRQNIIEKHPSWIGNLDGIPMNDRHKANMVWLPIMQAEIDKSVEDYEPKQNPWGDNTPEYEALLQKQRDIHALSAMFLNDGVPKYADGRSLLVLDNSGERLRAAVGSGNVDDASHVMVFTPGMDSTVEGGLATTDGKSGKYVNSTERIVNEADRMGGNQHDVASVTWLGYDAPQGWVQAASSSAAQEARPSLSSFYDGLQESHHGDPHLTAAGHSYGSLATAYALQDSSAPDDVSIWGSPGTGTMDASDLNMLPDHMFATTTDDDYVAHSGWYGGNPSSGLNSDFTALDTGAHRSLGANSGHSHYTDSDTTSLHNQAQILRDHNPDYVDEYSINTK